MFTGLVEELATVVGVNVGQSGAQIELQAKRILTDMHVGDSIAVNGVCLTVVRFTQVAFTLDAVPETLRRSNLSRLQKGHLVHVERALAANGRFGGHIVSGHIDGVGALVHRVQEGIAQVVTIRIPGPLLRYVVPKGSICVDGISLTVMDVSDTAFRVALIPHTGQVTMLSTVPVGTLVNLECDVLAKYVEKMLGLHSENATNATKTTGEQNSIQIDFLVKNGFA